MTILPLFPLNAVLVPGATLSLQIFEPRYQELLRRCRQNRETFGVVLISEGREVGGPAVPFAIGTEAEIVAVDDLPGGRAHVLVEGRRRFTIRRTLNGKAYLEGEVEFLPEPLGEAESWRRTVLDLLETADPGIEPRSCDALDLSYRLADLLAVEPEEKQELLEAADVAVRLQKEAVLLLRTRTPERGAS